MLLVKPKTNKETLYELRNEALKSYFGYQVLYDCLEFKDEKRKREALQSRDIEENRIRQIDRILDEISKGSYHYPTSIKRTEEE